MMGIIFITYKVKNTGSSSFIYLNSFCAFGISHCYAERTPFRYNDSKSR